VAPINSTKHTQKPRLRDRTDTAWFSRLLGHPARKRSGSTLSSSEPTRRPDAEVRTEQSTEGKTVLDKVRPKMKKRSERHKHCALAKGEPKIFAPPQTPIPGGAGRPEFNQLEMVTTFTYRPSLVKIDVRNFELSW